MKTKILLHLSSSKGAIYSTQDIELGPERMSNRQQNMVNDAIDLGRSLGFQVEVIFRDVNDDPQKTKELRRGIIVFTHEHWNDAHDVSKVIRDIVPHEDMRKIAYLFPFHTAMQISRMLNMNHNTVRQYVQRIYELTGCHNEVELLIFLSNHSPTDSDFWKR